MKISKRSIDIYDGTGIGLCMLSIWGSVVWMGEQRKKAQSIKADKIVA